MTLPIVYLYGPEGRQKTGELRHSLRSLANVPHAGVWVAGWAPPWAAVEAIPVPPVLAWNVADEKHMQTTANLMAACGAMLAAGHRAFSLWNDDFFAMAPTSGTPNYHLGLLSERCARMNLRSIPGTYHLRTLELLREMGIREPLSYETHTPMIVNATLMAGILRTYGDRAICKRTLYGNLAHLGGSLAADVKVYGSESPWPKGPWVSTSDVAFAGPHGLRIRRAFPEPSPYEFSESADK